MVYSSIPVRIKMPLYRRVTTVAPKNKKINLLILLFLAIFLYFPSKKNCSLISFTLIFFYLIKELNIKNDRTKIGLFVGRLELENTAHINQKNPDFGFSVAIELVKQYDDWIFIFVGKP